MALLITLDLPIENKLDLLFLIINNGASGKKNLDSPEVDRLGRTGSTEVALWEMKETVQYR
jgi:hypothetical protein